MICQRCGIANGTIQIWEIKDGMGQCQWLCPICAAASNMSDSEENPAEEKPDIHADHGDIFGSFLGHSFHRKSESQSNVASVCSSCGFSLERFQKENRLGCPDCYSTFRRAIMPALSRIQRRVLHVGRIPSTLSAEVSPQANLVRLRVALELAIQKEDYEDAAKLRDEIKSVDGTSNTSPEELS